MVVVVCANRRELEEEEIETRVPDGGNEPFIPAGDALMTV